MQDPTKDIGHLLDMKISIMKNAIDDFCEERNFTEADPQKRIEFYIQRLYPEYAKIGPHEIVGAGVYENGVPWTVYSVPVGKYMTPDELEKYKADHPEQSNKAVG